jgi:hypothetical protein
VCCYNRCHGNSVKGLWTLWDYICYCCVFTASDFRVILVDQYTSFFRIIYIYIYIYIYNLRFNRREDGEFNVFERLTPRDA